MSQHSLNGSVTRLAKTVDRMEEKMVNRRLEEVQGKGENMMWRNTISGLKEMKDRRGQAVGEVVVEMCEMARVRVEQFKGDISVVLERRNINLMSNN